jgi:hypothetical protein
MSDESLEAPEADRAEQQADVVPARDSDRGRPAVPLEVDPADAAEQAREVALDEDEDYR